MSRSPTIQRLAVAVVSSRGQTGATVGSSDGLVQGWSSLGAPLQQRKRRPQILLHIHCCGH